MERPRSSVIAGSLKSCPGCGTLRTREFERFIYSELVKKLAQFQTLTGKREKVNPKLSALNWSWPV